MLIRRDALPWRTRLGPWLIAAAIVVGRGRMRSIASFWVAIAVLFFCSLLWVFWTGVLDIQFHLDTAADRTSITFMMFALVGMAHLATSAVRLRERAPAFEPAAPERPALTSR
jgi:hypothetical protein